MNTKRVRRSNLIIRVAFILIFIFLFVSVINLQIQMRDLRKQRDALAVTVQEYQDSVDELEVRIATPIDDEYIERIARDRLGYRKPGEIIYYNDIAN